MVDRRISALWIYINGVAFITHLSPMMSIGNRNAQFWVQREIDRCWKSLARDAREEWRDVR